MKNESRTIQQSIASNKFYPPIINPSQSLQRYVLIEDRLPHDTSLKIIVLIEAQAGQGKTTLAHQYLTHKGVPYIWYQIGTEDNDPVLLLSALQLALTKKVDEFSSVQLTAILQQSQVGPLDFQSCANLLLHDIDSCLKDDLYIVFDDLHLLNDSPLAIQLLDYLIDTSPPKLHFILTSRHPLNFKSRFITRNPHLTYLDTNDLALDISDIEDLYQGVFNTTISRAEAEDILKITNGWIMGIILAAHPFAQGSRKQEKPPLLSGKSHPLASAKDGYFLEYFEEEIFSQFPEELHETFQIVSFLDEIDITLAKTLTNCDDIDQHLDRMADKNFFVYHLDDQKEVFRLHHLFQEFLQVIGKKTLGNERVSSIFRRAADYYLSHHLIEKALKALRSGEDYSRMESILKSHGLELVSNNRTVTILGILQSIPEAVLFQHTWLAFFHGLLATDFTPRQTLPFFESCRTQFALNNEETGELMSLSQIIYYHFVISGRYNLGSILLERTKKLFERTHLKLPSEISIIVARNLAAGYCFFKGEMDTALHYAELGSDLAARQESPNFIAATRFILCYIGLLSGNRRFARSEIEKSYPLASDPLVGMSNRITLHVMQLCELSMHGNEAGFKYHKEMIQASVDEKVVRQTIAAPYLFVWSAIGAISRGKPNEALEIIEQGMFVSKTASTDHMTSQFLQWRAFAHALTGNREQALKDIEISSNLREESGGPFYLAYNMAVTGAAYIVLGERDEADRLISEGLKIAEKISSDYIKACCLAYKAYIAVTNRDEPEIKQHIVQWLEVMKARNYRYFWGWEPAIIEKLLSIAVQEEIETEFAKLCSQEQLSLSIRPDGSSFPLLDITVLGDFSIGIHGKKLFGPHDLSALQRDLLGLLISSPDQRMSQEQVQLAFWPDTPPDKARKRLDTLLSRLRTTLSEKLNTSATNYIGTEKGYVQLSNTNIDAINFIVTASSGLASWKQKLWWQAHNDFVLACSFWSVFSVNEIFFSDQALAFSDEIQEVLRQSVICWSAMLLEHSRHNEALSILEKTARILALDEDCIKLRHYLYLRNNNPIKAREVLAAYRQELLKIDYTEKEADNIISALIRDISVH